MPAIVTLPRDIVDLAKRAHRLTIIALTCLAAAWPLQGGTQPQPARPAAAAQQQAPGTADPLQAWFREQDRLLDDILARLGRIEVLVDDIYRLISRMPDGRQAAATAPAPAAPVVPPPPPAKEPAPAPKPVAEAKKPRRAPPPEEESEPAGAGTFLAAWGPPLGGLALLALVLFWWMRRRRDKPARPAPATAAQEAETPAAATKQPEGGGAPAQAQAGPVAAAAPLEVSTSSGQADQALELAEIMLSMGLGHGAAQTLTEQIRNEPKQALRHWLKLLEVYRRNGQQAEFERSAEELRLHFNVKPEDWLVHPGSQQSIENFPHIAARIVELWRGPDCLVYLENLLADNRGGARSGFPQAVAEELLLLSAILRSEGFAA